MAPTINYYNTTTTQSPIAMNDYIRPITDNSAISITPEPIFVIKSKLVSAPQCKLFINVCHSPDVPAPATPFDPSATYSAIMNNAWEIPIVTSPGREDTDKKGETCMVFDCIINSSLMPVVTAVNNFQLKEILVEWCVESVEVRENVMVQRDVIKFPKMKFKGDVLPVLEIRGDAAGENETPTDENSAAGFLQMRRDLVDNERMDDEENGLKTLFPQSEATGQASRPLIEEIAEPVRPARQTTAQPSRGKVNFNVVMRRPKVADTEYKLCIEIDSELDSSLDLQLTYDAAANTLHLKNLNTLEFEEKELQLPLPDVVRERASTISSFKTYFIKRERKLYIFI